MKENDWKESDKRGLEKSDRRDLQTLGYQGWERIKEEQAKRETLARDRSQDAGPAEGDGLEKSEGAHQNQPGSRETGGDAEEQAPEQSDRKTLAEATSGDESRVQAERPADSSGVGHDRVRNEETERDGVAEATTPRPTQADLPRNQAEADQSPVVLRPEISSESETRSTENDDARLTDDRKGGAWEVDKRPEEFALEAGRFNVPKEVESRWVEEPRWTEEDADRVKKAASEGDFDELRELAKGATFGETGGKHAFYNRGSLNRHEVEFSAHLNDRFTLEQTAAGRSFDEALKAAGSWDTEENRKNSTEVMQTLSLEFAKETKGAAFIFERNGKSDSIAHHEMELLESLHLLGIVDNVITDTPIRGRLEYHSDDESYRVNGSSR